jgi:hypothetical protein
MRSAAPLSVLGEGGKSMTDLARFIGSLVCRVFGPIVNACFYPDGLVLLGAAATVFTLATLVILWALLTDFKSAD